IGKEAVKLFIPLPTGGRGAGPSLTPFDIIIDPDTIIDDTPEQNKIEQLLGLNAKSVRLTRLGTNDALHKMKVNLEQPSGSNTIYYRPVWPYEFKFCLSNFKL